MPQFELVSQKMKTTVMQALCSKCLIAVVPGFVHYASVVAASTQLH